MPRCPDCFVPLTRTEEAAVRKQVCPGCAGVWLTRVALGKLSQVLPDPVPTADAIAELAATVARRDNPRPIKCLDCGTPMEKTRYVQMVPVGVDKCRKCETFWLSGGKLPLLQTLNHELKTSTDPEVVRRRDKVAGLTAEVVLEQARHDEKLQQMADAVELTRALRKLT